MTETQQRFLQAIAERVPPDHIVEVHLFPSIRQGGVETGVAVVAEAPPTGGSSGLGTGDWGLGGSLREEGAAGEDSDANANNPGRTSDADAADAAPADAEATDRTTAAANSPAAEQEATDEAESLAASLDDAPPGPSARLPRAPVPSPDVPAATAESPVPGPPSQPRYTVHAARYRLTLKGPERGKWEVDVVAEADAPLEAVDAVVRGVQRRAGETADPERLTGDAFRTALAEPAWMLAR